MNKKAIWLIIGLMAGAVVGVGALQFYWINGALSLKQEEFDSSVRASLSRVVDKLDEDEVLNYISDAMDIEGSSVQRLNIREEARLQMLAQGNLGPEGVFSEVKINCRKDSEGNIQCDCPKCEKEKFEALQWNLKVNYHHGASHVNQLVNPRKLVERINISNLDKYLSKEFEKRGIRSDFSYGVYSSNEKSFVIYNGYFAVNDDPAQHESSTWSGLLNSKYKIDLYADDFLPPGMLMIQFPNQRSLL